MPAWTKGWRLDLALSAAGHTLAFAGILWLGWPPAPIMLGVALQTVAIVVLVAWRVGRGAPGFWVKAVRPFMLPAAMGTLAVGLLAWRLAAQAGEGPFAFWGASGAASLALFLPFVRALRNEALAHSYPELTGRDVAALVARTVLVFALAFLGNTWLGWPLPSLPDAATMKQAALVAVMVGFACDAVQAVGRHPRDFLTGASVDA